MAGLRIPYTVKIDGRLFWQPNGKMRARGARPVACGPDGPEARRRALEAYEAWRQRRASPEPAGSRPAPRTLAAAFGEFRQTSEWKNKEPRTREEWERCWARINPAFGGCYPSKVTMRQIDRFRDLVEKNVSLREAHRCIKIWRALWKKAAALKYCKKDEDPSFGITNTEPKTRSEFWEHAEVIKLGKAAWRKGNYALTAIIAVAWDTSFSPIDVRSVTTSDRQGDAFHLDRAKTGQPAIGTLQRRAQRILDAYIASLGFELMPKMPMFWTPGFVPGPGGGRPWKPRPYTKDKVEKDFADLRKEVFGPEERRTLADFRRSGTVEAIRGGAENAQIAAKMGNQFDKSPFLRKTYAPVDLGAVRAADAARKRARK